MTNYADITKPETWYYLKLGDCIDVENKNGIGARLVRVIGGWLLNGSFIPYSTEFNGDRNG